MKLMIDGIWRGDVAPEAHATSHPIRTGRFRGFVTADGSSGFPAAAGRYHLYAYRLPDVAEAGRFDHIMMHYHDGDWGVATRRGIVPATPHIVFPVRSPRRA